MAYSTPSDVYAYGLPRGSVLNPGRSAFAASAANDWIELEGHGLSAGDAVVIRVDELAGGELPSPLADGVTYYAIPVDDARFKVSAAPGGDAINLTTDGIDLVVVVPLPMASAIAWADRLIDDMIPAHLVPLEEPYPPIVVMTSAELAAGKLLSLMGTASETLAAVVDTAHKRLARWSKGIPIRGTNAPPAANLAASSLSAAPTDTRGWRAFGGI